MARLKPQKLWKIGKVGKKKICFCNLMIMILLIKLLYGNMILLILK